jgi:hypothetical protein
MMMHGEEEKLLKEEIPPLGKEGLKGTLARRSFRVAQSEDDEEEKESEESTMVSGPIKQKDQNQSAEEAKNTKKN